jgi:hypothetical protein
LIRPTTATIALAIGVGCNPLFGLDALSFRGASGASSAAGGAGGGGGGGAAPIEPWSTRLGGSANDYVSALAKAPNGDLIFVGSYQASVSFGSSTIKAVEGYDMFVALVDPRGNPKWAKGFGGKGRDEIFDVSVAANGEILIGGSFEDLVEMGGIQLGAADASVSGFHARLSPDGAVLAAKSIGSGPGTAVHAVVAAGNATVVAGYEKTASDGIDGYLRKVGDTSEWTVTLGGAGDHYPREAVVDSAGNVYLASYFDGATSVGSMSYMAQEPDLMISKWDSQGKLVWARQIAGSGNEVPYGLALGTDEQPIVIGTFSSTIDFGGGTRKNTGITGGFMAALTTSGAHQWSAQWSGPGSYVVPQAVRVKGERIAVAGALQGNAVIGGGKMWTAVGQDAFVVELNGNGDHLRTRLYGGPEDQGSKAIAMAADGALVIAYDFQSTMTVDELSLMSAGYHDAGISRLPSAP